jgi:hypothetical protein
MAVPVAWPTREVPATPLARPLSRLPHICQHTKGFCRYECEGTGGARRA